MLKELHLENYPIRVLLCTSFTETQHMYDVFGVPFKAQGAAFVERLDTDNLGAIFVIAFDDLETALRNDILCHELIHLKNQIFEYVGVKLDFANDEPEAYYYGYLYDVISSAIRHNDTHEVQPNEKGSLVHYVKTGGEPSESDTV